MNDFTRSGVRRAGDEYQDLVALDVLIAWLEHPARYRSVRVEDDESGYLDDVVAKRTDGTVEVRQVKFSTHTEDESDPWDWESLIAERQGARRADGSRRTLPSLLAKWGKSYLNLNKEGKKVEAAVVSNRRAGADLQRSLNAARHVEFDRISDSEIRAEIARQLGGENEAQRVFSGLRFELDQPELDVLDRALRRRFAKLGGDEVGWRDLTAELRRWVRHRDQPAPNGIITLGDVRRSARWYTLQSLPQRFEVPADFVLPSEDFHDEVLHRLRVRTGSCLVLTGGPGMGKSTYVSRLYDILIEEGWPVVRHHYFLSLADRNPDRLEFRRTAESLMHDLIRDHSAALGQAAKMNPDPDKIHEWLKACGSYYEMREKPLVVIIDGLDHVWRMQRSIDELRKLIQVLLPVPEGVVVFFATQPVPDEKLPPILLRYAPRDSWLHLPPLNSGAVRRWLRHHEQELALSGDTALPEHQLDALAKALFSKSGGHPLYLRYTFRSLQERGLAATPKSVRRLPGKPHVDIAEYYLELWRELPEGSRIIGHLLAACRFPWPQAGLFDCLESQGFNLADSTTALRHIDHLLVAGELGRRPFHGSFLIFVADLPDHLTYADRLRSATVEWLEERADEHWRWAYTWMLRADLGDAEPLRTGPNYDWLVDAIASRKTRRDIHNILGRSTWLAIRATDFPRAVELGSLRHYGARPFEYYRDSLVRLLFPQLVVFRDSHLRDRLHADRTELTILELALLAEAEASDGKYVAVERCHSELVRRLRTGESKNTGGMRNNWRSEAMSLLAVEALRDRRDTDRIIEIAVKNRDRGYTAGILRLFARQLRIRRDAPAMRRLLESAVKAYQADLQGAPDAPARSGKNNAPDAPRQNGPGDVALATGGLKGFDVMGIVEHAVFLALELGLDFDALFARSGIESVFTNLYERLRHGSDRSSEPLTLEDADDFLSADLTYDQIEDTAGFFRRSFFCLLVNHLQGGTQQNTKWMEDLSGEKWQHQFMRKLDQTSQRIADKLDKEDELGLKAFYDGLGELEVPTWPKARNQATLRFANAAKTAARKIGFDLLSLHTIGAEHEPVLTKSDVLSAFESGYCDSIAWMDDYVERRAVWLDHNAYEWLVERQIGILNSSIDEFWQRAEDYALLASIATLHEDFGRAGSFIQHAAHNLVAHGHHKDMLLFHALGAVQALNRATNDSVDAEQVDNRTRTAILSLAPAIAKIGSFTDSDETGHLPRELADVLAEIAPDLLPTYFLWLCDEEDYSDAIHTFREVIRTIDLSHSVGQAVASTAVDTSVFRALTDRANEGDAGAQAAVASLTALLGREILANTPDKGASSESSHVDEEDRHWPNPAEFAPAQLSKYLSALREQGIYERDVAVRNWAEHWSEKGAKSQVLASLIDVAERESWFRVADTIFDLALSVEGKNTAYPWLVKAHKEDHGWMEYFSEEERGVRRWELVARYYGQDRWADFIRDTLQEDSAESDWKRAGFNSFAWRRLTNYVLFMDRFDVAERMVGQMIDTTHQMLSPVDIPAPAWVEAVTDSLDRSS